MRIVPIIIAAIALLAIPLVWLALRTVFDDWGYSGGVAIDSGARIEIERLSQQIEGLQGQVEDLNEQIQSVRMQINNQVTQPLNQNIVVPSVGPNTILDAYAQVVLIADRRNVNEGITVGTPSFLKEMLGSPRDVLSDDCEPMTSPDLKALLVLADVGPIRVQMLQPAVDSLTRVFENVRTIDPDLYARINTAGSLCVRQIRGTTGLASTHSFGLAVDLNIDGHLDILGDGKTQLGLTILADFFRAEGWVWGAAFGREDSMHFEISRQMLVQWRQEGVL